MARRVSARGFVTPKPGSDKETLHLIEMDDPSGRGGGYHSGKYDPSTGDEKIARVQWDRKEPWDQYWARWQREFKEANEKTHAWLRAFRLRVHGRVEEEDDA